MSYFNLENLKKDSEGYVYYKDVHVEHFSHTNEEDEKIAAQDLWKRCVFLESLGVKPNSTNCVWSLDKILEEHNLIRVDKISNTIYGEVGIGHEPNSLDLCLIVGESVLKSNSESFFKKENLDFSFLKIDFLKTTLDEIPCEYSRKEIEKFINKSYKSNQDIELKLITKTGMYPHLEVTVVFEDERVSAPSLAFDEKMLAWFVNQV